MKDKTEDCMDCERCDTENKCPGISESRLINLLAYNPTYPWPDPKPEDLEAEDFNLIWDCIKTWDINVPEAYEGYCGATGNHVMSILFAAGKRNITDYC